MKRNALEVAKLLDCIGKVLRGQQGGRDKGGQFKGIPLDNESRNGDGKECDYGEGKGDEDRNKGKDSLKKQIHGENVEKQLQPATAIRNKAIYGVNNRITVGGNGLHDSRGRGKRLNQSGDSRYDRRRGGKDQGRNGKDKAEDGFYSVPDPLEERY